MKNKARCKYLKKIFACCVLVFLLISISVPCFATGVYPTQVNSFPGRRVFYPSNGWSYDNCVAVADIVENAYRLNYFSAGVPVAVISVDDYLAVLVVPSVISVETETPISGVSYEGSRPPNIGISRSSVYCYIDESDGYLSFVRLIAKNSVSGVDYRISMYYLNEDNTFSYSAVVPLLTFYDEENPSASKFDLGYDMTSSFLTSTQSIIAVRYGENDWRVPYADTYSDVDSIISDLDEWYDDRITPSVVENNFNYELDIPSIITAIPNSAKQIINNAFGFELFGINVAGLLSVILVVAIVGFVVKWLMSR